MFNEMDTALASQFGRQIGRNSRTGRPIYSITNREGYNQALKAKQQAKDAGFASVDAMNINRQMRNQLESKAIASGMAIKDAYALVPGGDLTNTQALQEAWNKITVQPPAQQQVQQAAPAPVVQQPAPPQPQGPSMQDVAAQMAAQVQGMQAQFAQAMQQQAQLFQEQQQAQEQRMAELQQNMIQSQMQMRDRPTVTGVKTASGTSGDQMQIARRGVSGAFGRRGMRIKGLNVG